MKAIFGNAFSPAPAATAVRWIVLALVLLAVPAQAHPESAAPDLRHDVQGVGHQPAVPAPGTQWQGHLQFHAGHNVSTVHYQICRVGDSCFAPPTLAAPHGDRFEFDTHDYLGSQGPVAWGMGDGSDWLIGYKFLLTHEDGSIMPFPQGLPHHSDECAAMSFIECDATHYFVFTIPGKAGRDVPAPLLLLPLLAALLARRDAHE